jgi:large subunit ribosomal protein L1
MKGKIDYRVDKNANIHVPIGKASFDAQANRKTPRRLSKSVVKAKPSACKGTYLKSCTMSSTMGPGFKMDPRHAALRIQERSVTITTPIN